MENYKITRSTAKTLNEWIALYERKTGNKVEFLKGFTLLYLPERGFSLMKEDTEWHILMIYIVCGDAKFWHDVGEVIAKSKCCRCISTICSREIEAYIRFWHWRIIDKQDINNQKRYICIDTQNRTVVITNNGVNEETNTPTYWVTQYISGERPVIK
ncbi:MAG: hypothetical protein RSA27_05370 [Oscillospiraceae bacterium]